MDPTSTSDEERELWMRFAASRDAAARLEILDAHLPFARIMAARLFSRRGGLPAEFADYLQSAVVGLIEAVDRYDPGRGVPFRHYAVRRIRGAVLDALPSMSELHTRLLAPGALQDRAESLVGPAERDDSDDDDDVFLLSLEKMADFTVELGIGFMLDDRGDEYASSAHCAQEDEIDLRAYEDAQRKELANLFAWLVPRLTPELARIVRYHYFCGIEFQAIAQMLGVTRARVSQLHREALKQLRRLYADGNFTLSA